MYSVDALSLVARGAQDRCFWAVSAQILDSWTIFFLKISEEMKYMMQDDVCDDGWVCIDGKCHCSDGSKPPTERPRLECRRVYMRMFARSGTFNLRFRHLNSERFSRSRLHFVHPAPVVLPHAQPSVPMHLVLHHALSSHMSSCLDQHRRLCVGVHAKLNVWCRACRSQVLGHRLRSGFVCVRREGVRGVFKKMPRASGPAPGRRQ